MQRLKAETYGLSEFCLVLKHTARSIDDDLSNFFCYVKLLVCLVMNVGINRQNSSVGLKDNDKSL